VMRSVIIALAGLSLIVALASCGKQATLQRPAPLWGARAKADYAAQKRAQAENATNAAEANKPIGPQSPALRPYTDPAPISEVPIPGAPTSPGAPNPNTQPPQ
jgi:hypothetical protein